MAERLSSGDESRDESDDELWEKLLKESIFEEPLTILLKKRNKFVWTEKCQVTFDRLKATLKSTLVLLAPDFDNIFKLAVDASDIGAGGVPIQEDNNGVDHPVGYFF